MPDEPISSVRAFSSRPQDISWQGDHSSSVRLSTAQKVAIGALIIMALGPTTMLAQQLWSGEEAPPFYLTFAIYHFIGAINDVRRPGLRAPAKTWQTALFVAICIPLAMYFWWIGEIGMVWFVLANVIRASMPYIRWPEPSH